MKKNNSELSHFQFLTSESAKFNLIRQETFPIRQLTCISPLIPFLGLKNLSPIISASTPTTTFTDRKQVTLLEMSRKQNPESVSRNFARAKSLRFEKLHERKKSEFMTLQKSIKETAAGKKGIKSKSTFLREIEKTLKHSKQLGDTIFNSIPRDPNPSFKVLRKLNTYTRGWSTHISFYDRNKM